MKDGYRYFITRPTAEDGNPVPVESSEPSYFRFRDWMERSFVGSAEFWDGSKWKLSVLTEVVDHLDDVLTSGATVREILDEKDMPHA